VGWNGASLRDFLARLSEVGQCGKRPRRDPVDLRSFAMIAEQF
jgi:hypothetical protein